MRTGRQRFLDGAEARYQAQRRRDWARLTPGQPIVVELDGRRVDVVVATTPFGDELEADHEGRRIRINRYQFCAVSPRVNPPGEAVA
jgi:hypothetical protein